MRVITGSARGRRLKTLQGNDVRPTSDKVKEALFSIIQFDIEGRRVLDLFAGSGQLGIEALSRGAVHSVFIDRSREAADIIRENLKVTCFEDCSLVVNADALSYLSMCDIKFDIVFVDPPYKSELAAAALKNVERILNPGAVVVCETAKEEVVPDRLGEYEAKKYKYGNTVLSVYR